MPSYKDQLYGYYYNEMVLAHHGVKGQQWGVRRYQNPDGSLTAAGRKRVDTLKGNADYAKRLSKSFNEDAAKNASKGRLISAYNNKVGAAVASRDAKKHAKEAAKIEKASAKAQYKVQKKNISKTRDKLIERDVDKIANGRLYGKTSRQEASRRELNANVLRSQQARAHLLNAKSEKNAKLAENSTGLSKTIREARSNRQARRAEELNKNASDTKKMINVTNDVYKKRLSNGEKFATDYLLSDSARNRYYANRANSSALQSAGRAVVDSILDSLTYAYLYG